VGLACGRPWWDVLRGVQVERALSLQQLLRRRRRRWGRERGLRGVQWVAVGVELVWVVVRTFVLLSMLRVSSLELRLWCSCIATSLS
jgi:hypothetical protein